MNIKELIKVTILGEEHLGENLKTLCIEYMDNLQQENEKLHHYKTLYQSLKKQKEELRSWLEEKIQYIDTIYLGADRKNYSDDTILDMSSRKWGYKDTLNKLEELEGVSNE